MHEEIWIELILRFVSTEPNANCKGLKKRKKITFGGMAQGNPL